MYGCYAIYNFARIKDQFNKCGFRNNHRLNYKLKTKLFVLEHLDKINIFILLESVSPLA